MTIATPYCLPRIVDLVIRSDQRGGRTPRVRSHRAGSEGAIGVPIDFALLTRRGQGDQRVLGVAVPRSRPPVEESSKSSVDDPTDPVGAGERTSLERAAAAASDLPKVDPIVS